MVGLLLGSYLGGPPADSFGRKPILFVFISIAGLSNFIGGLVSNIWPYAFFRMMAGIGEQGMTQVSFTLSGKNHGSPVYGIQPILATHLKTPIVKL